MDHLRPLPRSDEGALAYDRAPAGFRLAQSLTPGTPQITQPKQAPPSKQPSIRAQSTVPTTEQENKQIKERVAKQEAEIRTLNAKVERFTNLSNAQAEQINRLNKQIGDMTRKGGSLVRAYCESDTMSRNTAGAKSNCAAAGYLCEPVSGLCKSQCTATVDCAPRYVCDSDKGRCIIVR